MSIKKIKKLFKDSADLKLKILKHKSYLILEEMSNAIVKSIQNDGKLLICGNGGSAADAQHLAAELLIRLRPNKNRKSLPALALALDTSTITACGNDYGFNNIYKRIIESIGKKNDVLLVISTSGNSPNILNALKAAKKKKLDACAKKVKSRYKVWPSAYASGAVAKCRKVGAKNWGNKKK